MTTLPADPDTMRLAQRVAEARGKPLSAVVRDAIEASAREAGLEPPRPERPSVAEKRRRLLEISDRSAARPILDARTADEILGYDEHGLPA
jgi:antitoxin VapB